MFRLAVKRPSLNAKHFETMIEERPKGYSVFDPGTSTLGKRRARCMGLFQWPSKHLIGVRHRLSALRVPLLLLMPMNPTAGVALALITARQQPMSSVGVSEAFRQEKWLKNPRPYDL